MKTILTMTLALISFNALADYHLTSQINNVSCTIINDEVTKSVAYNKSELTFSESKKIKSKGVEALIKKAVALSTGRTMDEEMVFQVKTNDTTVTLNMNDSVEALALIRFISAACN